jgi:hypothetical protein
MDRRGPRGMGRGRRTRRTIARGGAGVAEQLNDAVGAWPRVRITPMFGRWGYFVGPHLFACFPLRAKDSDLWIRLSPEEQARALRTPGITPHRRFGGRGWVECRVESPAQVGRALRWLRRSYEAVKGEVEREERASPGPLTPPSPPGGRGRG